jgi:hypothetical protein
MKLNSYHFRGIQRGYLYSLKSKLIGNQLGLCIDRAGIISDVAASFLSSNSLTSQQYDYPRIVAQEVMKRDGAGNIFYS